VDDGAAAELGGEEEIGVLLEGQAIIGELGKAAEGIAAGSGASGRGAAFRQVR